MKANNAILGKVLDSMSEHIAVIDANGQIQYVNKAWKSFFLENGGAEDVDPLSFNYLKECDKAAEAGNEFGITVVQGLRDVLSRKKETFEFEYPCHSPTEKRWFLMDVTSFVEMGCQYLVIRHKDITKRKLAVKLARIDGLTNIQNRRSFEEFIQKEWCRSHRLHLPISVALIDLDHFKILNDTYGHQIGDQALVKVGAVLKKFTKRPSDFCARYGGEEFVIVWGNTDLKQSESMSSQILNAISGLDIKNERAPTESNLTASIGLCVVVPDDFKKVGDLIGNCDKMLYQAKQNGRNRVAVKDQMQP